MIISLVSPNSDLGHFDFKSYYTQTRSVVCDGFDIVKVAASHLPWHVCTLWRPQPQGFRLRRDAYEVPLPPMEM